jgi:MFS family permease
VLCAAAPGIGWLIAARAVQGIGGALMTPASLAIIEAAFRPGDRTRAIGTWAGFSGVSSAIAPFLGGWLLEIGGWRFIFAVTEWRGSHPMLPPAIFRPAQFRAANAVTFVINGALGGFAFVFIPALEIVAGYSPVVAGSALVPVTVVTLLLSGTSGRLAQRIGPRPQLGAGCLLCAAAFACAAVLAAAFITGARRGSQASESAHIQTPVPPLACPVDFGRAPPAT